jgi:hypothetical protein
VQEYQEISALKQLVMQKLLFVEQTFEGERS